MVEDFTEHGEDRQLLRNHGKSSVGTGEMVDLVRPQHVFGFTLTSW